MLYSTLNRFEPSRGPAMWFLSEHQLDCLLTYLRHILIIWMPFSQQIHYWLLWTEQCLSKIHMFKSELQMWQYLDTVPLWKPLRLNEVIRVGLWPSKMCPYKNRLRHQSSLSLHSHWEKAMYAHKEKVAVCMPGESSPELDHAGTRISDFQLAEWQENKFLLFKPPSLWYFVMADWVD